ncbi:NUDIX domain-containing protein [Oleomonas cavernae]|uniref:NUDIX domain-containing protein n=1 Tax=Oleomonas cavernae TaxID=2320859 RepID=A0A418WB08_9PROT|nr:NUDIX domain-containing protein [Oleomonas cavernae]RJF87212.1 NUDIX domain-containing protein [Oleomonas cavernae]
MTTKTQHFAPPLPKERHGLKRAVRPRDAATLILHRRAAGGIEVLMGRRHEGHRFMPGNWVFPGGRLDRGDLYVPAQGLRAEVAALLGLAAPPRRVHGLAVAAVRETFEETGLMIGVADPRAARLSATGPFAAFRRAGLIPALDALDYAARAITPPYRSMRFHARFFIAPAQAAQGEARPSPELTEVAWVPLKDARKLDLPRITGVILDVIEKQLNGEDDRIPAFAQRHGKHVIDYDR